MTRIEWADETWNPMTGCTPVSEGCEHCYAERMAGRNLPVTRCPDCNGGYTMPGPGGDLFPCERCNSGDLAEVHPGNVGFAPTFHPDRLDIPLHWRKPRRVFVCSMSDLFHEAFTDQQILRVLDLANAAPQHTYMVLTKRPARARSVITHWNVHEKNSFIHQPLPNLWLGVTAENQQRADERIPILLDTPAAVRFVSVEPMLGPVDLAPWLPDDRWSISGATMTYEWRERALDWVILGGETGPGARPMQPEWALHAYCQCKAAGVPFFWKQAGKWLRSGEHFSEWAANHVFDESDPISEWSRMVGTREFPAVTP
jgi:protein gp37